MFTLPQRCRNPSSLPTSNATGSNSRLEFYEGSVPHEISWTGKEHGCTQI